MRIAITADPYLPVPPMAYGGIERVVDFVCRGLAKRGHQVTLFAHPQSNTAGQLVAYGCPPHRGITTRFKELWQLGSALYWRRKQFDVVISWGRLAALLPILPFRSLPKIQRYCRDVVPWTSVARASRLAGNSIRFAGASTSVYRTNQNPAPAGCWVTIHDGVEVENYTFVRKVEPNAPLAFLGRLHPMKGAHFAIAVAKAATRQLIIAGNREKSADDPNYFEREIAPHLDKGQISYIGPVNDAEKNVLLGKCAALLFPSEYKEAFGIVMAEAMACGTPVLAKPRGSVSEVVRTGVSGFVCDSLPEFVESVLKLESLDRKLIRCECETRFDAGIVVKQFEELCLQMITRDRLR